MRVSVNRMQCGSTGYCAEVAPEVFRLPPTGPAEVLLAEPGPELRAAAEEAEELCPTRAIRIDYPPGS